MTECCLFVCWRPRTYQRLVNDIFLSSTANKYDEDVQPSPGRVDRLVEYATTYPNKLRFIARKLDKRFMRSLQSDETGFVLIAIEVYRKILESYQKSQLSYMLEQHLNYILSECLRSKEIIYLRAAAHLIKYCVRLHAFSTNVSFITAILELCNELNESENATSHAQSLTYVGFTMLIPMLKLLHHNPHWLELYLVRLTRTTIWTLLQAESSAANVRLTDENIDNVNIECQALFTRIKYELPKSLSDVCWKTITSTCATTSFAVIHTVMDTICQVFQEKEVPVSSAIFLKVAYIVVTSFHASSGHVFALDHAIMEYITTRLHNTMRPDHKKHDAAEEEETATAGREYHYVQDGSEPIARSADNDLHTLHETIHLILLWKTHQVDTCSGDRRTSVDSSLHSIRSILLLLVHLIICHPFLTGMNLTDAMENGEGPAMKLVLTVRSLPSALTLHSQATTTTAKAPTDAMSEQSDEAGGLSQQENTQHTPVFAVMKMLYMLTRLIAEDCEPLGNNLTVLWDGILHTISDIERSKLHGKHNNNRMIPFFRTQAMYLSQILLDKLDVDFQALQLGAATSITVISNSSWEHLHSMVADVNNWEELRHVILCMMKMVCVAQPIVKRMRESKDQALQATQGSIIRGFSFYPFSPQQLHTLQSVIFEDLMSMRGLCPLRINAWYALQALLIRCFGEYIVIQELPMLLSLLHTCQLPVTEEGTSRLKQRAMYLRAYLLGYFLFVAGLCKIPELITLLQQWHGALIVVHALPKDIVFDFKSFSMTVAVVDLEHAEEDKVASSTEDATIFAGAVIPALQPLDLMKRLLTNTRFQALTMYVTKAFESPLPFVPFTKPLSALLSQPDESGGGDGIGLSTAALSVQRRLFDGQEGESDAGTGDDDASSVGSATAGGGGVKRSMSRASSRRSSTSRRKGGKQNGSRSGSSVAGTVVSGIGCRNGGNDSKKGSLAEVETFTHDYMALNTLQRTVVWRDQFALRVHDVQAAQSVEDFLNLLP